MKNLIEKLLELGLINNKLGLVNGVDIKIINNIAGLYNLNFSSLTEFYCELFE